MRAVPTRRRVSLHTALALPLALCALGPLPARAAGSASVLPAGNAVAGWKQVGKPRAYNAANLFDLVNGEAQAIQEYSFAGCTHAEYAPANQTKPALTIDVFDMTDPLNAFGLFSSDRISGKAVPLGAEGVKIGNSGLNFWKGRYVVRTAILNVSPAAQAAQLAFAKAAAAKIPGNAGPPPIVAALPAGRQPRSEKYVKSNVAGQAFLKNAVTARYPSTGQGCEVFIATYPAPAAAKAALEKYRSFEKSGTGLAPLKGVGEAGFSVVDRYAKNVAVAQKGKYVVGVVRAKEAAGAQKLLREAVSKVR
jgi:hypothetical protein